MESPNVPSEMRDLAKWASELTTAALKPEVLHETPHEKVVRLPRLDGTYRLETFDKPEPNNVMSFLSIDSLTEYVGDNPPPDNNYHECFVGIADLVTVDLAPRTNVVDEARVILTPTDEFRALAALKQGCSQKMLHRLLCTDLHEAIDPSLLLAISAISFSGTDESHAQINGAGLVKAKRTQSYSIKCKDDSGVFDTELAMDWTWHGQIWNEFNHAAEISLRLYLDASKDGLIFQFLPRQLNAVMDKARMALVNHLKNVMPESCRVYYGQSL